ncbi:unnamed protein product [Gadus morhua 'NCC']
MWSGDVCGGLVEVQVREEVTSVEVTSVEVTSRRVTSVEAAVQGSGPSPWTRTPLTGRPLVPAPSATRPPPQTGPPAVPEGGAEADPEPDLLAGGQGPRPQPPPPGGQEDPRQPSRAQVRLGPPPLRQEAGHVVTMAGGPVLSGRGPGAGLRGGASTADQTTPPSMELEFSDLHLGLTRAGASGTLRITEHAIILPLKGDSAGGGQCEVVVVASQVRGHGPVGRGRGRWRSRPLTALPLGDSRTGQSAAD